MNRNLQLLIVFCVISTVILSVSIVMIVKGCERVNDWQNDTSSFVITKYLGIIGDRYSSDFKYLYEFEKYDKSKCLYQSSTSVFINSTIYMCTLPDKICPVECSDYFLYPNLDILFRSGIILFVSYGLFGTPFILYFILLVGNSKVESRDQNITNDIEL